MNKTFLKLATVVLASASTASAANYVGGSVGTGASIHYQTDLTSTSAVRYGLNLAATNFNFSQLSVGGTIDYLTNITNSNLAVSTPDQTFGGLTPYYGFGLGAGIGIGNATGVSIYPHALAGLKYQLLGPLSVYGEVNAGLNVYVGTLTSVGFGTNARIGVNYQF